MAESNRTARYWCYSCQDEVPIYMAPDPTCQRCNEQFIEEMDDSNDDPRAFLSGQNQGPTVVEDMGDGPTLFRFSGEDIDDLDDIFRYFPRNRNPTTEGGENETPDNGERNNTAGMAGMGATVGGPLGSMLQSLVTNMLGPNADVRTTFTTTFGDSQPMDTGEDGRHDHGDAEPGQERVQRQPMLFYMDNNMRLRPMNAPGQTPTGTRTEEGGDQAPQREGEGGEQNDEQRPTGLESIFQLLGALTGAPMTSGFVGNPNDYVFSQNALDNIITQLMEQTAGRSAPPPASDEVIESLKKRSLTEEEIGRQADCAVCKDEFAKVEQVIELPCQHIFHEDCIKPWLKMNGTCPVCRHAVDPNAASPNPDTSGNDGTENNNNNENGPHPSSHSPSQPRASSDQPTRPPSSETTAPTTTTQPSEDQQQGSAHQSQPSSRPESSSQEGQGPTTHSSSPMNADTNSTAANNGNSSNVNSPASTMSWFSGGRQERPSTMSPSAWPTSIPGAFTWGPGGQSRMSPARRQEQDQSQRNTDSDTDMMDLDLD